MMIAALNGDVVTIFQPNTALDYRIIIPKLDYRYFSKLITDVTLPTHVLVRRDYEQEMHLGKALMIHRL
jgi:hypothetical protein